MRRNEINWKIANIAGVEFSFPALEYVSQIIAGWRQSGRRAYIVLSNPHSVMLCRRDSDMRDATGGADLTLADGVGIVVGGRMLGHNVLARVTGPSLMLEVCDKGRAGKLRHFFYGGGEGVADILAARLASRFPSLQIAGTYCPPFRSHTSAEQSAVVDQINATRPDVVWVGLGAPKQEKWMAEHVGRINAAALIGVGAAFDFHSGNIPWAPKIIRKVGCEWAYRLTLEPRRMWRRNLDSPLFLASVACQGVGNVARAVLGQVKVAASWTSASDDTFGGSGSVGAGGRPSARSVRPRRTHAAVSVGAISELRESVVHLVV